MGDYHDRVRCWYDDPDNYAPQHLWNHLNNSYQRGDKGDTGWLVKLVIDGPEVDLDERGAWEI